MGLLGRLLGRRNASGGGVRGTTLREALKRTSGLKTASRTAQRRSAASSLTGRSAHSRKRG